MTFTYDQTQLILTIVFIAAVMGALQGTCAYLILAERKISAWAQDRLGPNRVGPWGTLQPIADGLKFLLKEEVIPGHVDKLFYLLAPAIAIGTATLAFAVVPFGQTTPAPTLLDRRTDAMLARSAKPPTEVERKELEASTEFREVPRGPVWPQTETELAYVLAADRAWAQAGEGRKTYPEQLAEYNKTVQFVITPHADIGIVWVFAIGSLAVYGIVLGGWSSNSKYSLLGGLRSSAQLISYEIPLGMSALGVFLLTGSLNLEKIIDYQVHHGWNVVFQPLAALLFITSVFAECNRLPFDLPEAEQELVGGYHTEYSALKFGLFFLGEYTHMITTSFLVAALFFGGWLFPGITSPVDLGFVRIPSFTTPADTGVLSMVLKVLVLAVKMALFIIFYMLIRWTIPRFRFDQLMALAWKVMMPLALINLIGVMVIKEYQAWLGPYGVWLLLPFSIVVFIGGALVSLRLPGVPARAPITYRGHPVTGAVVVEERVTVP